MKKDFLDELYKLDDDKIEELSQNSPLPDEDMKKRIVEKCLAKTTKTIDDDNGDTVEGIEQYSRPRWHKYMFAAAALAFAAFSAAGIIMIGNKSNKNNIITQSDKASEVAVTSPVVSTTIKTAQAVTTTSAAEEKVIEIVTTVQTDIPQEPTAEIIQEATAQIIQYATEPTTDELSQDVEPAPENTEPAEPAPSESAENDIPQYEGIWGYWDSTFNNTGEKREWCFDRGGYGQVYYPDTMIGYSFTYKVYSSESGPYIKINIAKPEPSPDEEWVGSIDWKDDHTFTLQWNNDNRSETFIFNSSESMAE